MMKALLLSLVGASSLLANEGFRCSGFDKAKRKYIPVGVEFSTATGRKAVVRIWDGAFNEPPVAEFEAEGTYRRYVEVQGDFVLGSAMVSALGALEVKPGARTGSTGMLTFVSGPSLPLSNCTFYRNYARVEGAFE